MQVKAGRDYAEGFVLIDPVTGEGTNGGGQVKQAVPDYESNADLLVAYGNFSEVNWAGGDFIARLDTSNDQTNPG